MNITIRSEKQKDYNAISEMVLMAFRKAERNFVEEVALVDCLRHHCGYDNELALVAEIDGRIVGYSLFSPCEVYFKNNLVKAVYLAPLGVHPDFQKKSIGSRLLEEGHRRAKEKGYGISLLYGIKDYYPRFGYKPNMFSGRGIIINVNDLPSTASSVIERPVNKDDIKKIATMWFEWHKQEPIAMFPGTNLMDWVSHSHEFVASSITIDNELVGYIRYELNKPSSIMSFIANTWENTIELLAYLKKKISKTEEQWLHIPVNPLSQKVKENISCQYSSEVKMSDYAMLKLLDEENLLIKDYVSYIEKSKDNIGVMNLAAQFEWC